MILHVVLKSSQTRQQNLMCPLPSELVQGVLKTTTRILGSKYLERWCSSCDGGLSLDPKKVLVREVRVLIRVNIRISSKEVVREHDLDNVLDL